MYGIPLTILVQTRKSEMKWNVVKQRRVFVFLNNSIIFVVLPHRSNAQLINKLLNKRLVKKWFGINPSYLVFGYHTFHLSTFPVMANARLWFLLTRYFKRPFKSKLMTRKKIRSALNWWDLPASMPPLTSTTVKSVRSTSKVAFSFAASPVESRRKTVSIGTPPTGCRVLIWSELSNSRQGGLSYTLFRISLVH